MNVNIGEKKTNVVSVAPLAPATEDSTVWVRDKGVVVGMALMEEIERVDVTNHHVRRYVAPIIWDYERQLMKVIAPTGEIVP